MKRESRVHRTIIKWLNQNGWFAIKLHGSAFLRGMPDILAVRDGRTFFIEVKMPGEKPTRLQEAMHHKLRNAGATVLVAEGLADLQQLLKTVQQAA